MVNFNQQMKNLILVPVTLTLTGSHRTEGYIVDVKRDFIHFKNNQKTSMYIPIASVRDITRNSKTTALQPSNVKNINYSFFKDLLISMKQNWLYVKRANMDVSEGVLSSIYSDCILIVQDENIMFIPMEDVVSVQEFKDVGTSSEAEQSEEQEANEGQKEEAENKVSETEETKESDISKKEKTPIIAEENQVEIQAMASSDMEEQTIENELNLNPKVLMDDIVSAQELMDVGTASEAEQPQEQEANEEQKEEAENKISETKETAQEEAVLVEETKESNISETTPIIVEENQVEIQAMASSDMEEQIIESELNLNPEASMDVIISAQELMDIGTTIEAEPTQMQEGKEGQKEEAENNANEAKEKVQEETVIVQAKEPVSESQNYDEQQFLVNEKEESETILANSDGLLDNQEVENTDVNDLEIVEQTENNNTPVLNDEEDVYESKKKTTPRLLFMRGIGEMVYFTPPKKRDITVSNHNEIIDIHSLEPDQTIQDVNNPKTCLLYIVPVDFINEYNHLFVRK